MIQCKTTQRMDVAKDIGVETPMKAIKVKHSQNIIQQCSNRNMIHMSTSAKNTRALHEIQGKPRIMGILYNKYSTNMQ